MRPPGSVAVPLAAEMATLWLTAAKSENASGDILYALTGDID